MGSTEIASMARVTNSETWIGRRNATKSHQRLLVSLTCGTLLATAGLSGCSTFSTNNAPADCNVVKTQAAAGKSDTQIAPDLNTASNQPGIQQTQITVAEVAACRGAETSGNKSAEMIPCNY